MKNVAIYVRVSTEEQKKHGISVDSQLQALKDYCQDHKYNIAGIYNDAGISARKSFKKRPAILKLIEDCQNHKIDLIIFTKLDRWFRSVADYYEVQSQLDACDVKWRAIWEDYETETSSGCFKVNIMLSIAQAESDRTSERIKAVFEYQRSQGKYVGCAPYGYKRENGQLVKDPETKGFVELAQSTYLETRSSAQTMRALVEAGCNISKNGLHRILSNPAYLGEVNGYTFEPYLTQEQFDTLKSIMTNNRFVRRSHRDYLFAGMCRCAICGLRMRAVTNDADGNEYRSYYCTGLDSKTKHYNSVYAGEKKLEAFMLNNIESLIDAYNIEIETKSNDLDLDQVQDQKRKLESKLKRIGIRYEEGDLSDEEYKEKRKAIQNEIASLNSFNPSQKIEIPLDWKDAYNQLDRAHKHAFWGSIIKDIHLSPKWTPAPKVEFLP